MYWSYAIINGRLGEIFFERDGRKKKPVILGHGYVDEKWHKTAREKRMIRQDTAKYHFSYRNKRYRDMNTGEFLAQKNIRPELEEEMKSAKQYASVDEMMKDIFSTKTKKRKKPKR